MSEFSVSEASREDIFRLLPLSWKSAVESNCQAIYDHDHAKKHIQKLVDEGYVFILRRREDVVGVLSCKPIDAGFAMLADVETTHVFIDPEARSFVAVTTLFKYVETFVVKRGLAILFHQCDYHAAVTGVAGNSERVERLYRLRGYRQVGFVCTAPSFARVGVTYLYHGDIADENRIAAIKGIRRPPNPDP